VVRTPKDKVKRDLEEETDLLDTMLTSLVEVLEEKGVVTQTEWEQRIKRNLKG
jgi:DNA-binding HxlR family transcriptional regulator